MTSPPAPAFSSSAAAPPASSAAHRSDASPLLLELKTRARLLLNAGRSEDPRLRLRDCLNQVARDAGFTHWAHGRCVLGGLAVPGEDMGEFWHAPRCASLLNHWFASVDEARAALQSLPHSVLLPYRRQFVVVQPEFIRELGLDPAEDAWAAAQRDLVRAYGGAAWLTLAGQRLRAPRASFAARW